MKNHLYKAALLAALGLALSPAAKANDLYVGFNDYATYGTSGDDYVIDLGAYTDFTTASTFSGSISSSLFSQAFGTDSNAGNNVAVGAVAGGDITAGSFVMATGSPQTTGNVGMGNALSSAATVPTGVYAASSGAPTYSWDYFVAQSPTLGDTSGNGIATEIGNPESSLSGGDVTLTLYEATKGTSHSATWTSFNELGTLTIDANSTGAGADTITFNGVDAAVPEPTTYGLCAGAGLLVLALRRQFVAKNA